MKISCDIIRDILPLYAENMTSQASSDMVDEHLRECRGCTDYLEELRKPARLPAPTRSLQNVKKDISKRRLLSVLTAVFLVLSLVAGVYAFLNAEIYLTAEQAIDHVEQMSDGTTRVYWRYMSRGFTAQKDDGTMGNTGNWGILMDKRRGDLLLHKSEVTPEMIARNIDMPYDTFGETDEIHAAGDNYWYVNPGNGAPEKLLRDGGVEEPEEGYVFMFANYRYIWYCSVTALLGAAFALAGWLLRGRRAGKFVRYFALFFGCVSLSALFASGGQFVSYHGDVYQKIGKSCRVLLPLLLTGYFAFELWDMSHPLPAREWTEDQLDSEFRTKRCLLEVLAVILAVFSLFMGVFTFLNVATLYMTADEAIVGVKELENGDIQFQSAPCMGSMGIGNEDGTGELHYNSVKRVLSDRLLGRRSQTVIGGRTVSKEDLEGESYWYLNPKDGTAEKLLWGDESQRPEEPMMRKNYGLAWYCAFTGACCLILLLLARFLPGTEKYLRCGALAAGCLCIAGLIITGGEFYKFDDQLLYRIQNSLPTAVSLFLTGLCVMKLRDLKKR